MAMSDDKYERSLEVVDIDDLKIDSTYQRPLSQRHVENILADLEVTAADAITVSKRRNGQLFIVNGQHITAALKQAGETEMLAFVYVGLTPMKEAHLRLVKNRGRADTPLERFHAQLAERNPRAIGIRDLLAEFGTHVNRSPSKTSGVNTVSALEFLWDQDGPDSRGDSLRWAMALIRDSFGEISGQTALADVIKACAWFLRVHVGDYKRRELVTRLNLAGIDDLTRKARSHKSVSGGAGWLNVYRAMIEVYNFKRGERARLEPVTRNWSQMPGEQYTEHSYSSGKGGKGFTL
jgi:hypothetical protein